LYTGLKLD